MDHSSAIPKTSAAKVSIYAQPGVWEWLDSLEGLPAPPSSKPKVAPHSLLVAMRRQFAALGEILPGVAVAVLIAMIARPASAWLGTSLMGFETSPIGSIPVAIVMGICISAVLGTPDVYAPGLRACVKRILQLGVVLLGLRLSLQTMGEVGLFGLPVVLICLTTALVVVSQINRLLGLPKRLGALIAVGTSICGVSAVVATASTIDADDDETAYAVGCVSLFGLIALMTYPYLSHYLFSGDAGQAGIFLGVAIHDTAQVAGAGLMYQQLYDTPDALSAAMVVKLLRNTLMVGVIFLMGLHFHRRVPRRRGGFSLRRYVPLFVLAFVVMSVVRTVGDMGDRPFGVLPVDAWRDLLSKGSAASAFCITAAMAAIGLSTRLERIVRLGWKSLCVGFFAAAVVGGVGALCIKVGTWLT